MSKRQLLSRRAPASELPTRTLSMSQRARWQLLVTVAVTVWPSAPFGFNRVLLQAACICEVTPFPHAHYPRYGHEQGYASYREALAGFLTAGYSHPVSPDDLMVTAGGRLIQTGGWHWGCTSLYIAECNAARRGIILHTDNSSAQMGCVDSTPPSTLTHPCRRVPRHRPVLPPAGVTR